MKRNMKIERFIRSGKRGTRFYFRVIGGNGEPMAQSEGYNTPRARNNAIKKLQENLAGAKVVDA